MSKSSTVIVSFSVSPFSSIIFFASHILQLCCLEHTDSGFLYLLGVFDSFLYNIPLCPEYFAFG